MPYMADYTFECDKQKDCEVYDCILYGQCKKEAEMLNRLGEIEDALGEDYDIDRIRELAEADREGRVKIDPRAKFCPMCGKYSVFPRIDWKYYYCFSCKTQFSEKEYCAALKGELNG